MRCTEDNSVTANVCIEICTARGVCQELPVPSVHVKGYLIGSLISEIESVLWEMNYIPEGSQHHFSSFIVTDLAHRPCSPSENIIYLILNNIVHYNVERSQVFQL